MNEQEQKLREEILADAQRKADRLVKRARRDADKAVRDVKKKHEKTRQQRLEEAEHTARGRERSILAGIQHELRRRWLERRETVLHTVLQEALEKARRGDGIDPRRSLCQLLTEALAQIGEDSLTVRLRPDQQELLEPADLERAARQAWDGKSAGDRLRREKKAGMDAGVIVETRNGHRRCDNTYAARLHRLRDALRARVAETLGPVDPPSVPTPEPGKDVPKDA